MERGLAVHAGSHGEEVIARRLALVLVLAPHVALAAPKKKDARAQFDKGVAAYTKGDFQKANEALAKSFALEADEETLFAWAQTERKLGHGDKAVELYGKLLGMNLPAENEEAVEVQIKECKQILEEERAAAAVLDGPATGGASDPTSTPGTESAAGTTDASASTAVNGRDASSPPVESPAQTDEPRAWWKDPVGGALVGAGVVGVALGTVFLIQGSAADSDAANATSYDDFSALSDRAESRGRLGVIGLVVGGALITGGVIWYATHKVPPREHAVTGWLAPSGGGLALSGRF